MFDRKRTLRSLCEGAILLAMAEILSYLPLYKMPRGGSVDLGMLPIIIFCIRWGFGPGLLVSLAHAILQMFQGDGIAIGWQSILGDYMLAYIVLCLAGLFRGRFFPAALTACVSRFLVHYVVGATVWAEYMPSEFLGLHMRTPWIYSALYNGAYMALDTVLVLLVGALLLKTPVRKYMLAQDL